MNKCPWFWNEMAFHFISFRFVSFRSTVLPVKCLLTDPKFGMDLHALELELD